MSLLTAMGEEFYIMNKTVTPDSEGGFETTWTASDNTFIAVLVHDTSLRARIAEREGVTNTYTVTTSQNTKLNYGEVIKRKLDNTYYHITSDSKLSPSSVTSLNMAQVTAEKWELTV